MSTVADQLTALLRRYLPGRTTQIAEGAWGPDGAPYRIEWRGDLCRITLLDPDSGDRVTGTGASLAEALAVLAQKLPGGPL